MPRFVSRFDFRRFPLAAAVVLAASPLAAEVCALNPVQTEQVDTYQLCASSVLPAGKFAYAPDALFAADPAGWCEGAPGPGEGAWLELRLPTPYPLRDFWLNNGYVRRGADSFFENARIRKLRIETDTGFAADFDVTNSHDAQLLRLPSFETTARVRFTVLAVYPGSRYDDLCVDALWPDFEAIRSFEWAAEDGPEGH
jgi:hypothetical protein